jgi:hypothetical protein
VSGEEPDELGKFFRAGMSGAESKIDDPKMKRPSTERDVKN